MIRIIKVRLVIPARTGDSTIHPRSTTGMSTGDWATIGTGVTAEERKFALIGMAATNPTTLWRPLHDGPVITIFLGSTNVPITNASGFAVGEKIAISYRAIYRATAQAEEKYEVATVSAVCKRGTQAYLAGC